LFPQPTAISKNLKRIETFTTNSLEWQKKQHTRKVTKMPKKSKKNVGHTKGTHW
jgi:hypothetical protein